MQEPLPGSALDYACMHGGWDLFEYWIIPNTLGLGMFDNLCLQISDWSTLVCVHCRVGVLTKEDATIHIIVGLA